MKAKFKLATVFCMLMLAASVVSANDLAITNVSVNSTVVEKNQPSEIKFYLNKSAQVKLQIYDARNILIREIESKKDLNEGSHSLTWNHKDSKGRKVPPEVYYYVLVATDNDKNQVVYDLTDKTGGQTVLSVKSSYDPKSKLIHYALPKSARVFIRIGIEGGNILGTVVNGVVKTAGEHQQPWDGWDQSHVVNLGKHPKLVVYVEGVAISGNALVIPDEKATEPSYLSFDASEITRREVGPISPRANYHVTHQRELCRDFPIKLTLPTNLKKDQKGLPIITGRTPIRVELPNEVVSRLESERFEVVYYLNNQLFYENEVSYTPYNWYWDPKTLAGGVHYMTAVVVGYSGHFGIGTVKFRLAKQ